MTQQDIVSRLRSEFADTIGEWREMTNGGEYQRRMGSFLEVTRAERLAELCFFLRDDPELQFNNLVSVSTVDNADGTLAIIYHLESMLNGHHLNLKLILPTEAAQVPTVTEVWLHANWLEREAWDMMGIRFIGHPDHRRIYLEEDWPGHPLRKDFTTPEFYHGLKVPY